MQIHIETKGFKPGTKLSKLLYERLQLLMQIDKDLVWTEFKLTFEEHIFHSELCLIFSEEKIIVTLCDENFYDALCNTIDFARTLLYQKRNEPVVKRKTQVRRFMLPKRMSYDFSSN